MRIHSARGARIARAAAALGIAIVLAGCATTRQSVGGSFEGAAPTPPATASTGAQARRVYYASVEGVKVYAEPSTSSKLVGTLALHEKVIRTKLERGYAFVESTMSGMQGWVDNAQLVWRLPAAPGTGAPTNVEAEPEEPEAPAREEPQAPPTPQAAPTVHWPTAIPAPTAAPRELPTPRPIGPSIFNPY